MTKEAMVRSMRRRMALEKAAAASAMPAAPSYLDRGTATTPAGTNYLGNAATPQRQPATRRQGGGRMAGLGKSLLSGVPGMPTKAGAGAMRRVTVSGGLGFWARQAWGSRFPAQTGYRQGAAR
jgi:hypothetical protein